MKKLREMEEEVFVAIVCAIFGAGCIASLTWAIYLR